MTFKNGASDGEVIRNIQQMLVQLRQQHPPGQARDLFDFADPVGKLAQRSHPPNQPLHRLRGGSAGGPTFADLQSNFLATTKACCGVNSLLMGCT